MNLDDALSLLGVTRDTDVASGRRAYLRLLKKHPPERDPEGFKRLRAAYELAQPYFGMGSPEMLSRNPRAAEQAVIEPNGAGQSSSESDQTPALPVEEASLSERFWEEDDPAAQEELARHAVRQTHSLEAYQLLLHALDGVAHRAEFIAAAREAVAHGHAEVLLRLCDRWPEALTDEELDDVSERRGASVDWPRVAIAYLERGKPSVAAAIANTALAREVADPFAPRAQAWWVLRLVARMFKTAPAQALPLFQTVDGKWANEYDGRDIPPAQRLLLRELAAVCLELPAPVCAAIATSIEEGDSATARDELLAFAGEEAALAKRAARNLKRHAPTLSAHFGDVLLARDPFHAPWYRTDWKLPWWSIFILLNLIRISCRDSCSEHSSTPDLERLKPRTVQTTGGMQ